MSSQPFLDPHRIGEMEIHISCVRFSGNVPDTSNSRLIREGPAQSLVGVTAYGACFEGELLCCEDTDPDCAELVSWWLGSYGKRSTAINDPEVS
jgi:hypothetical protein